MRKLNLLNISGKEKAGQEGGPVLRDLFDPQIEGD
jgi:hypothetical protein